MVGGLLVRNCLFELINVNFIGDKAIELSNNNWLYRQSGSHQHGKTTVNNITWKSMRYDANTCTDPIAVVNSQSTLA